VAKAEMEDARDSSTVRNRIRRMMKATSLAGTTHTVRLRKRMDVCAEPRRGWNC
jgi:hypothetical protein